MKQTKTQHPAQEEKQTRLLFFSQMNIFFRFLFFSSRSLSLIVVVVIDVYLFIYTYISIHRCSVSFFPMIHLFVCMCMYVHNFPCDYFSPFYVVIMVCVLESKQEITLSEFFHISVYKDFFSTSVAAIELFTFSSLSLVFIIIILVLFFFFRSLSCCCLMMFYVCKYVRVCVWDIVLKRDRAPSFFLVK